MVILVLHSIGDIIFCEPIFRFYWKRDGFKPRVVIRDHLMWMQNYIESAKFLQASTWEARGNSIDRFDNSDEFLNLRFANPIFRGLHKWDYSDFENCMLDKYRLSGIPEGLWRTMQLQLDPERGAQLFHAIGLHASEEYILVNEHCQAGHVMITPANPKDLRIVHMREVPGFNVIDWAYVMMLATENHHVSTSTFFILQATLNYRAKEFRSNDVHIYPRPNEDGLRGISQLQPDFNLIRCNSK